MALPIVLNSSHAVDANTFVYQFPRGSIDFENASVGLSQINVFYSWRNITSQYNNQTFQFIMPDGTVPQFTEYTVTIPEGNYTIENINQYLQHFCIQNGLYLVNGSGNNVYYLEFLANPQTYKIDFIAHDIPTSLPSGFSNPAGFTFPNTSHKPTLVILNNNFGKLIGFDVGGHFTHSSDFTPQMGTVSSVLVTCSLINNRLSNPNNVLYSFVSGSTEYGRMISVNNQDIQFSRIPDGRYNAVTIKFLDQEFRPVNIIDTNLIIYLIIKIE